ncbi:MAG: hypothetical protein ACUVT6_11100 [Thermodesulfobacteriota bacterium]
MKICINCVLPETFPGIRFNERDVCNYCLNYEAQKERIASQKEKYLQKFLNLLNQLGKPNKPEKPEKLNRPDHRERPFSYDVLIAYSGGKDSSYTLKILKENYGLRILALTFDNGFLSSFTQRNIENVCSSLGIDRLMVSPNLKMLYHAFRESISEEIYPLKALERASSICNTCMNLVKSYMLKTAIEMGIPFMAYGWSPGQAPINSSIMKWNTSMIKQIQASLLNVFRKVIPEDQLSIFLLMDRHYQMHEAQNNSFLYNIHPLAFLDYDEKEVLGSVRELGWREPLDTDTNSTNCLLNSLGIELHQKSFGFHPYAFEIAGLVRAGHMSREEGLKKLHEKPNREIIEDIKKKLELP